MKLYLADRIGRKKASTIHNDFSTFRHFERWLRSKTALRFFNWADLNEGLARSFLSFGLRHTSEKGNPFSRLRTFYKWGVARQYLDFETDLFRILQTITAAGNAKGHHVRFRHPLKGPFSPDELLLIRHALDAEQGTERDRALVMVHFELGHNPSATTRLKRGFFYRAFEVGAYLLSLRVKRLWTVNRRDGTYQMLSETLLIVPRNFFGSHRLAHPLLVEPVAIRQFSDFLCSRDSRRGRSRSAFERFGICEADGSSYEMTTHQFRHLLNDIADKGGLPTELQTRWMGREHTRDTDAYRRATVDERLRWVKDGIREGKLAGPQSAFYFDLPHAQRDRYLDGEIQAVPVTPLGLCLHDFPVTPCPYHLNCVRGCSDYLRTKGSVSERRHLVQIQKATKDALSSAQKYSGRSDARIAEPWIRHCEETLEGVKKALAIDDEPSTFAGDLVRASPNQLGRFEKSLG